MIRLVQCNPGIDVVGAEFSSTAHLTVAEWQTLRADIKAGLHDDLYPSEEFDVRTTAVAEAKPDTFGMALGRAARRGGDAG